MWKFVYTVQPLLINTLGPVLYVKWQCLRLTSGYICLGIFIEYILYNAYTHLGTGCLIKVGQGGVHLLESDPFSYSDKINKAALCGYENALA